MDSCCTWVNQNKPNVPAFGSGSGMTWMLQEPLKKRYVHGKTKLLLPPTPNHQSKPENQDIHTHIQQISTYVRTHEQWSTCISTYTCTHVCIYNILYVLNFTKSNSHNLDYIHLKKHKYMIYDTCIQLYIRSRSGGVPNQLLVWSQFSSSLLMMLPLELAGIMIWFKGDSLHVTAVKRPCPASCLPSPSSCSTGNTGHQSLLEPPWIIQSHTHRSRAPPAS